MNVFLLMSGVPNGWAAFLQWVTQQPGLHLPSGSTPSQQTGGDKVTVGLLLNHINPEVAHTTGPCLDAKGWAEGMLRKTAAGHVW